MPAFLCSAAGMKGFARACSGQASSVSPLTQSASNSSPSDSMTPSTCTGASGVSGWNRVSAHSRRRPSSARASVMRGATRSSRANSASVSFSLARSWNSSESRPRSPGKPAASSAAVKKRAQSCGEARSGRGSAKSASSRWRSSGQRLDQADELAERQARRRLAAQRGVEPRALRHLGLRAGDEGRAQQPRGLLVAHFAGGELEQRERGVHQRIVGERRAERQVEGQRALRLARQVVRRMQGAREHARDFLPALAELRHHHADAPRAGLELRARPLRGGFELGARRGEHAPPRGVRPARRCAGGERDPGARAGLEKRLRLRLERVEAVGDDQLRRSQRGRAEQRRDQLGQPRCVDMALAQAALFVGSRPGGEGDRVVVARELAERPGDAPGLRQRPGACRLGSGLRQREQRLAPAALADRRLPQRLRLRGAEEQRQARPQVGVQRVLVEPLDEGGERQDVRGFPDRAAGVDLALVELARRARARAAGWA